MTPLHEPPGKPTRIVHAVRAYASQRRQEYADRAARRKVVQARILALHQQFAQIRMTEMRQGKPPTGNLSDFDMRNLRALTATVSTPGAPLRPYDILEEAFNPEPPKLRRLTYALPRSKSILAADVSSAQVNSGFWPPRY